MSSVDGVTKGRFHGQEGSQQVEKASELVFCENLTPVCLQGFSLVRGPPPSAAQRFLIKSVSE